MHLHDHHALRRTLLAWHNDHGTEDDAAHDTAHFDRVWQNAMMLADGEGGDRIILTAAAYLHDLVNVPKDSPLRSQASALSAEAAAPVLKDLGFSAEMITATGHAITAHSWSAKVPAETLEARILQDADRLDSLGAVGVARCFAVSGMMGRALVDNDDPLAENRPLDDIAFTLDHFLIKLEHLTDTMQTATGRRIATDRTAFLVDFRKRLADEVRGRA